MCFPLPSAQFCMFRIHFSGGQGWWPLNSSPAGVSLMPHWWNPCRKSNCLFPHSCRMYSTYQPPQQTHIFHFKKTRQHTGNMRNESNKLKFYMVYMCLKKNINTCIKTTHTCKLCICKYKNNCIYIYVHTFFIMFYKLISVNLCRICRFCARLQQVIQRDLGFHAARPPLPSTRRHLRDGKTSKQSCSAT